jgi:hypothetical protein
MAAFTIRTGDNNDGEPLAHERRFVDKDAAVEKLLSCRREETKYCAPALFFSRIRRMTNSRRISKQ